MLSLTAKAIHLDGRHSDVAGQFSASGGSIGRDAKCDLVLPDPDRRISRLQARIIYTEGQYVIRNTSTSNPMYVNGVELSPGSSQVIASGDELRAGSYVITVADSAHVAQALNDLPSGAAAPEAPRAADAAAPALETDLGGPADPLLALGPDGLGQPKAAGPDPFADLLAGTAVGQGSIEAEPRLEDAGHPPSSATSGAASEPPQETSAGQKTNTDNPIQAKSGNPFGNILGQARPSRPATTGAASSALSADMPLQSRHNLGADTSRNELANSGRTPPGTAGANTAREQPLARNPFEPPKAPASNGPNQSWTPPLSGLAGDPFADLMGPSVESHIARVPVSGNMSQRASYIPDDFNPLAVGGVAHRNSSDPLTPLGRHAQGLTDVIPVRTIDSIYAPGGESPSLLAVDPLNESRERALHVEQGVDPMKLFSTDERGVNALLGDSRPDSSSSASSKSIADHTPEMAAFFRAPTARFDPAVQKQITETSSDLSHRPTQPPDNLPPQQVAVQEINPIVPTTDDQPALDAHNEPPLPPDLPASPVSTTEHSIQEELPSREELSGQEESLSAEESLRSMVSSAVPVSNLPPQDETYPVMERFADPSNHNTSHTEPTENLIAAFKRGAGLEDWPEQSVTPELMETIGRILQATAQGMVLLLATRATVKQEIHLSVTLINPKSNNPLKFLPDGHTALLQMLGPRIPGFMAPVDAMEEAFEDLITHQTAIAAGTQAAIKALFRRFDPDSIESQNPQNGVSEKISNSLHQARLWNAYKSQYRMIRDEVKDDFFKRLGADFHEAYNREYDSDASGRS